MSDSTPRISRISRILQTLRIHSDESPLVEGEWAYSSDATNAELYLHRCEGKVRRLSSGYRWIQSFPRGILDRDVARDRWFCPWGRIAESPSFGSVQARRMCRIGQIPYSLHMAWCGKLKGTVPCFSRALGSCSLDHPRKQRASSSK